MTHILSSSEYGHSLSSSATALAASWALGLFKRLSATVGRSLAAIPRAIGQAFAMAYVNPYTQRNRTDWSDPENF